MTGVLRLRRIFVPIHCFCIAKWVMNPALRLRRSVPINRHTAKFHPMVPTLKKKISGSIEGDAIQKDMTGAKGTPLISSAAMTGITPQEQKGLNAPTMVARRMAVIGLASKARFIYLEAPDIFTATARGIVTNR